MISTNTRELKSLAQELSDSTSKIRSYRTEMIDIVNEIEKYWQSQTARPFEFKAQIEENVEYLDEIIDINRGFGNAMIQYAEALEREAQNGGMPGGRIYGNR